MLLSQCQNVVCLTDERPPGPAFMPLFKRVMPAVSSVAKPRQALVSSAIPEETQVQNDCQTGFTVSSASTAQIRVLMDKHAFDVSKISPYTLCALNSLRDC